MDLQKISDKVDEIYQSVAEIKQNLPRQDSNAILAGGINISQLNTGSSQINEVAMQSGFKITRPLDPLSRQIIQQITAYPVAYTLKNAEPATAANYGLFFTSDKAYKVDSIVEVHGTSGTDASAVTLQIEKLTGTTAMGSGTNILTTAFNLKGTINTPQYGTLVQTENIVLRKGDRMALKLTGTPTAVANLNVTVYLKVFYGK